MKLIKLFALIIVIGFVFTPASSQSHQVRIGCVGNSITIGAGLTSPETECYPAQLQILLNEKYGDTCVVENFAVSGRTMLKNGDYPIWDESDFRNAYMYAPDILLILLGTNDTKPQNWDSYGEEFYDDYISMIDTFKMRNPFTKFIVCYPPPAFEINWGIRDSVVVHGVIPAIDSVLDDRDAVLVDFYEPLVDSVNLFPDKIHPSAEGSVVMAEIVFDQIVETNLIHDVELGNTFITSLTSKQNSIPVKDSATISWTTINADSVWLQGILVDSIGTKNIQMNESGFITLIAKGKKTSDTLSIYVEAYIQEITRIQIDPFNATANMNDEVDLIVLYYDQNRKIMEDTITDIAWGLVEGEGEFINQNKNQVTFVVGNQPRSIISATYGDLTGEMRITVEDATFLNNLEMDSQFVVYPNPISEDLTLTFNTINPKDRIYVNLLDVKGSIVKTNSFSFSEPGKQQIKMNVSKFPNGVYFLQVKNLDKTYTRKIILK